MVVECRFNSRVVRGVYLLPWFLSRGGGCFGTKCVTMTRRELTVFLLDGTARLIPLNPDPEIQITPWPMVSEHSARSACAVLTFMGIGH